MKNIKPELSLIFSGAVLLCYVAFMNHFPVVYSDTGTYLYSGFFNIIPWDRPVFYGLFIRHISLATSPWLIVIAQGLLVSFTVFKTLDIFYSGNKKNILFVVSIVFLVICTGISYNTSILLPDIFGSLCILSFLNILLNTKLSKVNRILFYILFIYSMLVHFSNFLLVLTVITLLFIYITVKHKKKQAVLFTRKSLVGLLAAVLSILIIEPCVNYSYSRHFSFSKGSHVFIVNHLLETGVLEEYLNDQCSHKNYKLCNYKDQLGWDFIWRDDSPFYKMGGPDSTREEYNRIIKDIVTTPKYCKDVILQSFEFSFIQFFAFDLPLNQVYGDGSPPLSQINADFKEYDRAYLASLQNNKTLDDNLALTKQLQRIIVFICLGIFICMIFIPSLFKLMDVRLKWLTVLVLIFCYVNAGICSNLSTIDSRFQDRIIWLIPFVSIIIMEHLVSEYLQNRRKNEAFTTL